MTQDPRVTAPPSPDLWQEPLGKNRCMAMVQLPGGSFWMGSPDREAERSETEGPRHLVNLPAFAISQYAVTQDQWKAVATLPTKNLDLPLLPSWFKGRRRPVEQISWYEAVEFCDRLSRLAQQPYRLPSEAEWEYACRAQTQTPFSFGKTLTTDQANYNGHYTYGGNPRGKYRKSTIDVGSFPANGFGLYDMHGNVWEWCQDTWHETYQNAPADGSAWIDGGEPDRRILRGGAWDYFPSACRSAARSFIFSPSNRYYSIGFRVVCGYSE